MQKLAVNIGIRINHYDHDSPRTSLRMGYHYLFFNDYSNMVVNTTNDNENVIMDRRAFFGLAIKRISKTIVKIVDDKINERASRWVRPPYAIEEMEFLLACTRCDKCITACPYNVIFRLSAKQGMQTAGTPAMDLLNKGCHLCNDWPCVTVCESGALCFSVTEEGEKPALKKIAHAEINKQSCLPYKGPECGACASSCPIPGALLWDMNKPEINSEICVGCGLCREICIVESKAITIHSLHQQTNNKNTMPDTV